MRVEVSRKLSLAGAVLLMSIAAPAPAANALAQKYGCLGCHATAAKLVGPAYTDVAAKYRDDPQAVDKLAQSIRSGGSGRWGDMPMPPQSQVSDADARALAKWILGGAK
jgi:cytochrome c